MANQQSLIQSSNFTEEEKVFAQFIRLGVFDERLIKGEKTVSTGPRSYGNVNAKVLMNGCIKDNKGRLIAKNGIVMPTVGRPLKRDQIMTMMVVFARDFGLDPSYYIQRSMDKASDSATLNIMCNQIMNRTIDKEDGAKVDRISYMRQRNLEEPAVSELAEQSGIRKEVLETVYEQLQEDGAYMFDEINKAYERGNE